MKVDLLGLYFKFEGVELAEKIDKCTSTFKELETWIANNPLVDKDKDNSIVDKISMMGLTYTKLKNEYMEVLNGKERVDENRYKELIKKGDIFIERIDSFKKRFGLYNMMAVTKVANKIKDFRTHRLDEAMNRIESGSFYKSIAKQIERIGAVEEDLYNNRLDWFAWQETMNEHINMMEDETNDEINRNDLQEYALGRLVDFASKKYVMRKLKGNAEVKESREEAAKTIVDEFSRRTRKNVLDKMREAYTQGKKEEQRVKEILAELQKYSEERQEPEPERVSEPIFEVEPKSKQLSKDEKDRKLMEDLENFARKPKKSNSGAHETENDLERKYKEKQEEMLEKKKEVKQWIEQQPEKARKDKTDIKGVLLQEGLDSRYKKILNKAMKKSNREDLNANECIGILEEVIRDLDHLMKFNQNLSLISEVNSEEK